MTFWVIFSSRRHQKAAIFFPTLESLVSAIGCLCPQEVVRAWGKDQANGD